MDFFLKFGDNREIIEIYKKKSVTLWKYWKYQRYYGRMMSLYIFIESQWNREISWILVTFLYVLINFLGSIWLVYGVEEVVDYLTTQVSVNFAGSSWGKDAIKGQW